jgi:hypothetical protein
MPLTLADIVAMAALHGFSDGHSVDLRGDWIHALGSSVYTGLVIAVAEFAIHFLHRNSTEVTAIAAPTVSNRWRMLTE